MNIFGPTKKTGNVRVENINDSVIKESFVIVVVLKQLVPKFVVNDILSKAPVSHIWYFKGIPSRMGLTRDMSLVLFEEVIYFAAYGD